MYNEPNGRRRVIFAVALLVTFIIIINLPSLRETSLSRFSRKLVLGAVYPFQFVLFSATSATAGLAGRIVHSWGAEGENIRLREEVAALRARMKLVENAVLENESLRGDIGFKASTSYRANLIAADIISRSPANWFETIIINKGSADGIARDDVVISKGGLVGRVVEASRAFSKVMLITDPESSLGVMIKRTKEIGVAVGGAMNWLQIKYLGAAASIEVGDEVLTSGIGGVFPKGIPVGSVTKTSARDFDIFRFVELRPMVDFSRLTRVFVIAAK